MSTAVITTAPAAVVRPNWLEPQATSRFNTAGQEWFRHSFLAAHSETPDAALGVIVSDELMARAQTFLRLIANGRGPGAPEAAELLGLLNA